MVTNLPTELLRSFVAIVDCGSMLRATERVFVTQSALSLQMKRLEETVRTPLFHREGRRLVLTPAGEVLLPQAREILSLNDRAVVALAGDALVGPVRVGLVQDFADTLLSGVLGRFAQLNPEVQIQARVAGSPELLDLLASDRLDVVLCMGAADDPAAARVAPMVWHGDAALLDAEVLPSAILEPPCRFRDALLAALERDGRPFRLALETRSLSALRAAVEGGLAVSCRTSLFLPDRPPLVDQRLPVLPEVAYLQRTADTPHGAIRKLGELVRAAALEL